MGSLFFCLSSVARARPPNYYTLDASTTAFLSSRIQKWDFTRFQIPELSCREEGLVVRECSLHSDACLDMSNDGDFMAVCIPSDSGSYSAVGIYSIRDESLGDVIHMFHFDQNTVSVSISPSSDYIVVGYAGRGGPLYRFVNPTRAIGQVALHYRKIGKVHQTLPLLTPFQNVINCLIISCSFYL